MHKLGEDEYCNDEKKWEGMRFEYPWVYAEYLLVKPPYPKPHSKQGFYK